MECSTAEKELGGADKIKTRYIYIYILLRTGEKMFVWYCLGV